MGTARRKSNSAVANRCSRDAVMTELGTHQRDPNRFVRLGPSTQIQAEPVSLHFAGSIQSFTSLTHLSGAELPIRAMRPAF